MLFRSNEIATVQIKDDDEIRNRESNMNENGYVTTVDEIKEERNESPEFIYERSVISVKKHVMTMAHYDKDVGVKDKNSFLRQTSLNTAILNGDCDSIGDTDYKVDEKSVSLAEKISSGSTQILENESMLDATDRRTTIGCQMPVARPPMFQGSNMAALVTQQPRIQPVVHIRPQITKEEFLNLIAQANNMLGVINGNKEKSFEAKALETREMPEKQDEAVVVKEQASLARVQEQKNAALAIIIEARSKQMEVSINASAKTVGFAENKNEISPISTLFLRRLLQPGIQQRISLQEVWKPTKGI